jgi:hypothetical protein
MQVQQQSRDVSQQDVPDARDVAAAQALTRLRPLVKQQAVSQRRALVEESQRIQDARPRQQAMTRMLQAEAAARAARDQAAARLWLVEQEVLKQHQRTDPLLRPVN